MKIRKTISLFLLNALLATGCHNDLDIVQNNVLSASNMWQDEEDVESAVYGTYNYLRNALKTNIIYWGEYRNGLWGPGTHGTLHNNDHATIVSSTMNSTNEFATWTILYTTINQANLIAHYAQQMTISQESKDFALAHAHFIRAFCYFWIGRIWGDAPLALEGFESTAQELYLSRSPQTEVFNQVELDLEASARHMQASFTDKTIASSAALSMLQADFGLWMYSVAGAGDQYLTLAESAIQSLGLSPSRLETEYASIYDPSNKQGREIIWSIHQENGESTGGFSTQHLWNRGYLQPQYINLAVPIGTNQWWMFTDEYIAIILADERDTRASVTYGHGAYGTNDEEVGWSNKFVGRMISGTRVLDSDIIIYRYAQAYLFDAEIKYYRENYQGALQSLGVITNRAYGDVSYYTDLSKDAVLDAIVTENLKEFASESNTYWMLIRTDKIWDYNSNIAAQRTKTNILLWPITQTALNRNYNLKQTEGWSGQ